MAHPLAPMIEELTRSFPVTRKVLDNIPADRLDWRPHPKAMTLGQLAMHVATIPLGVAKMATSVTVDLTTVDFSVGQPTSKQAILAAFEQAEAEAVDVLRSYDQQLLDTPFAFVRDETEIFAMPRSMVVREIVLNHLYHHRGQLTTYLRSLDCPVPAVYGTSAEENPFAAAGA